MPDDTVGHFEDELIIIGGGFAGSLLALKLAAAGRLKPTVIECSPYAGPGLAYGDGARTHLLNVPAVRMDVGLTPSFVDWLKGVSSETAEAVVDAGDLAQAFVPRTLFGRYLREQIDQSVAAGRIRRLRGEVTGLRKSATGYEGVLADGRCFNARRVVLATGNAVPRAPELVGENGALLADSPLFVPDPWDDRALHKLEPKAAVLLIGTGLTMTDTALALAERGHVGPIYVISRRGLMPLAHLSGGSWPAFLGAGIGQPPVKILKLLRQEVRAAQAEGVPWQRVVDAARPVVALIWSAWSRTQRSQFLRHARPFWDIHRHRLAPRIARDLQTLIDSQRLIPLAGKLRRFAQYEDGLNIVYATRRRREIRTIRVARVINCTGPCTDFRRTGTPLFLDMKNQGLIHPDTLGLGIDTNNMRVIDAHGQVSDTLFAIGGLTRPALWEVTAVPEIAAQVSRLVQNLDSGKVPALKSGLAREFSDLGAGI